MTKRDLLKFIPGSAIYVIKHAKLRKQRNKMPSMAFRGQKNPIKALALAVEYLGSFKLSTYWMFESPIFEPKLQMLSLLPCDKASS